MAKHSPILAGWFIGRACQGFRVLSVMCDLWSSVVLTRYTRSLVGVEDMVFGGSLDDRVQVVTWRDSVECVALGRAT